MANAPRPIAAWHRKLLSACLVRRQARPLVSSNIAPAIPDLHFRRARGRRKHATALVDRRRARPVAARRRNRRYQRTAIRGHSQTLRRTAFNDLATPGATAPLATWRRRGNALWAVYGNASATK